MSVELPVEAASFFLSAVGCCVAAAPRNVFLYPCVAPFTGATCNINGGPVPGVIGAGGRQHGTADPTDSTGVVHGVQVMVPGGYNRQLTSTSTGTIYLTYC